MPSILLKLFEMKKTGFILFFTVHFAFVITACCLSAYKSYCDFYRLKKNTSVLCKVEKILSPKPIQVYGDLSACQYGFGFFAPNVKSGGCISFENDRNVFYPEFRNKEAKNRFSVFECQISDFLLDDKDSSKKNTEQLLYDSLKMRYYNLIYKAISAKLYNQNNCTVKNSSIGFSIFEYPALKEYRQNIRKPQEIKLYQINTILNN